MDKGPEQLKWSQAEQALGDRFLNKLHELGGNFEENKDKAAAALSGDGKIYRHYYELPQGTRSYVAHKAAFAKKQKQEQLRTQILLKQIARAKKNGEGLPGPGHEGMTQAELEAAN